jgi:hypothetical protein
VTIGALLYVTVSGVGQTTTPSRTSPTTPPDSGYPSGNTDASEPSGKSPPTGDEMPGFTQTYVSDFPGTTLPPGWTAFSGVPAGVPDGQFGTSHVVVKGGLLRLNVSRDAAYSNRWVTGGVCLCTVSQTYGAYFVRSRLTGGGPNNVQLLWPTANVWPPEIDFYETGGKTTGLVATVHYGAANNITQRFITIDLTKWHTFGVVWQRDALVFTVDGRSWGTVTLPWQIPDQPMTLHLQQQASCALGLTYWCPREPSSMEIDWVAIYARSSTRGSPQAS